MNLIEARTKLEVTISRLEDLAQHDPIRNHSIYLYAVALAIKDGRELLEGIERRLNKYRFVVNEAKDIENLMKLISNLDETADCLDDGLADCLAQHGASVAGTVPVSGTTILGPDEFDALLGSVTREGFLVFCEFTMARYMVIEARNPQSKKEVEQIGHAIVMAKRNRPNARAETIARNVANLRNNVRDEYPRCSG